MPLLTGARLEVLAPDKDLAQGRRLLHLLQRGATVVHASARVWGRLVETEMGRLPPALKMMCSGVDLSATLADRLLSMGGELWTLYGYPKPAYGHPLCQLEEEAATTSIGEPIANTALYVLDANLRPAPVGATGTCTSAETASRCW